MGAWFYFAVTLVIELPVIVLFFKRERKFALLVGFLLNLFTWPVLHILLFYTSININILETGVAITESAGYYLLMQCSRKKALALGFIANAISYGIGLVLNNYI